jgi:hypothetical protein
MFMNRAIGEVIGTSLFRSKSKNFARRPHTREFTQQISVSSILLATCAVRHILECWISGHLLATCAVRHILECWISGQFVSIPFEAERVRSIHVLSFNLYFQSSS